MKIRIAMLAFQPAKTAKKIKNHVGGITRPRYGLF